MLIYHQLTLGLHHSQLLPSREPPLPESKLLIAVLGVMVVSLAPLGVPPNSRTFPRWSHMIHTFPQFIDLVILVLAAITSYDQSLEVSVDANPPGMVEECLKPPTSNDDSTKVLRMSDSVDSSLSRGSIVLITCCWVLTLSL